MEASIVGLGLMGGSLGLALRKKSFKVYGFDISLDNRQKAKELCLVDEIVALKEALSKEIVILATPVDVCIDILNDFSPISPSQTILDLGSVKEKISNAVRGEIRQNFVAAHPMTGTEYSGPSAAKEGLYEGCTVVLCDLHKSGDGQRARARALFESIGAKCVEMDSKTHDLHAAYISHLPHIISFSLAGSVLDKENPQDILSMAAGGFRDMSRLAKSRPDLWTQIFRQNRENLLESMELFLQNFNELKGFIEGKEWDALEKKLQNANELHLIFKRV